MYTIHGYMWLGPLCSLHSSRVTSADTSVDTAPQRIIVHLLNIVSQTQSLSTSVTVLCASYLASKLFWGSYMSVA